MPQVTTRRKCPLCSVMLEVGDEFIWQEFRFNGVDKVLPVHPHHDPKHESEKARLEEVKIRAAANGHANPEHHIQEAVIMGEQSIVAELKNEIERAKLWGYGHITHDRLLGIIRKHEVQVPGDISQQPGQWQVRGGNVDAIQHDGTEAQAGVLQDWVTDRGGKANIFTESKEKWTYLRLDSPRRPNIVGPGWWVIKTADGIFYTMPDSDFHIIYVPREDS